MTLGAYPASLPAPQRWIGVPRERRAASALTGNTQHRGRSRNALQDIDALWTYEPEQMTIFEAWYETDLVKGQRWFTVLAPGPGGWIPRAVKFRTGSLRRQHLGFGIYRISALLEQRGEAHPGTGWSWALARDASGWRYFETSLTTDYSDPDFDDSGWLIGQAPFGSKAVHPAADPEAVGTWPPANTVLGNDNTRVWLRRNVSLGGTGTLSFRVKMDNSASVYINGDHVTLTANQPPPHNVWHRVGSYEATEPDFVLAVVVVNTGTTTDANPYWIGIEGSGSNVP